MSTNDNIKRRAKRDLVVSLIVASVLGLIYLVREYGSEILKWLSDFES